MGDNQLFVAQPFIGGPHGAARDAKLRGEVAPGGQTRAAGEPAVLDRVADGVVNLGGKGGPGVAVDSDWKRNAHAAMVQEFT